jgi:AraC-like DNA-binding protein
MSNASFSSINNNQSLNLKFKSSIQSNIKQKVYLKNIEKNSNVSFKEPAGYTIKILVNWLFILNSLFGIFLSIKILLKNHREKTSNIYFSILLTGISSMLFELALFWWENLNYNPQVSFFRMQYYFWFPSLYLYFRNKSGIINKIENFKIILHYTIPSIFLCFYIYIHFFNNTFLLTVLNSLALKTIHTTIYLSLLVHSIIKFKNKIQYVNKKWIITLFTFNSIILIILIARSFYETNQMINSLTIFFTAIFISIFINITGIILYLKPEIILHNKDSINKKLATKYKNSGLTNDMLTNLKLELEKSLSLDKVYLDNTLTLQKLAIKLDTDRYSLSQTINQEFKKNYYELINDYRVAEAVKIIENSDKEIMITDLIYESGFNNKVSFYKAFKKRHQKTPLEYQKTLEIKGNSVA